MIKINRKLIILALIILIFYIGITSISAASFDDVQDKIDIATSGDEVYLENTTYEGSGMEITVNKDLTIHGGSAIDHNKKSTLDAKRLSRIFDVTGNHNVSFINLILINGKANNNNGGSITISNSNFILINCTFINSSTTGDSYNGGAIYHNGAGSFSVVNSSFINSSTKGQNSTGGAIFNYGAGSFSVVNSSFMNSSTKGQNSTGGAIFNYGAGSFSVVNSSFINSSTNGQNSHGGDIYHSGDGIGSVVNSSFVNSSTKDQNSTGGAISHSGTGSFSVVNSSFMNSSTNGQSSHGGAIFNYGAGSFSVVNSSFMNSSTNGQSSRGGAISHSGTGSFSVVNSSFMNSSTNNINSRGGAIFHSGDGIGSVVNSSFVNSSTKGQNSTGGAIFNYGAGSFSVVNSSFMNSSTNGQSSTGGTIYHSGAGSFSVVNSSFMNSSTKGQNSTGGTIYHSGTGSFSVVNSSFMNSSTNNINSRGGTIFNYGTGSFSVVNSSFMNSSTNGQSSTGGTIYHSGAGSFSVVNSSFMNSSTNGQSSHGGAIYHNGAGSFSVVNSSFMNSSTNGQSSHGGAIYHNGAGSFSVVNSSFMNSSTNGQSSHGGAIFNYGAGSFSVVNSSFMNCSTMGASSSGGAIYANGGNFSVVNSSFVNSSTTNVNSRGGAVYMESNANLTNNIFIGSSAIANGGVIYNAGTLYLKNNTMENSTVSNPNGGREIYNNNVVYIANLTYLDNTTINVIYGHNIELWANITDDMGNTITGKNINFIIEGNNYNANAIEGLAKINFNAILNPGVYTVHGNYSGHGNKPIILKNGTLIINAIADLTITKTVNVTNANYGEYLSYTITVFNNGPNNVTGVIVNEKLPDGLVYVSDNGNGKYDHITGLWTIGNLTVNDNVALVITVRVNKIGNIINVVNVTANEYDNNTVNNKANITVLINAIADLTITKTVNVTNANYGEYLSYTITVFNNGPNNVTGVIVNEKLPDGLVYVSDNGNGKYDHITGLWTIGNLTVNDNVALVITVRVNKIGNIINVVNVTANEYDNNTVNNKANITVLINAIADLTITKTVNVTNANYGEYLSYTITVFNNGPNNVTGVIVNEKLPDGLVYVSDNGNGKYDHITGLWTIGNLTVNDNVALVITVRVNKTGNIINVVNVTANEYDNNTVNNKANITVLINAIADLTINKTVNVTNANYGEYLSYTITVFNNGPNNVTGVIVNEKLPDGLVYVSDNGNGKYDHITGLWTIGNLTVNDNVALVITVRVNKTGNIINVVNVTANEYDNNTVNNKANITVLINAIADLTINKTVNVTNANYGEYLSYTITVFNNGPNNVTGVIVNEKLPDGLVYVSDNGNGKYDHITGLWTIGNLTVNDNVALVITVRVNKTGNIINVVNVTANEYDNNTVNNKANITVKVNQLVDLVITISSNKKTVYIGDVVIWAIKVKNNDPCDAIDTYVLSKLPSGFKYISSSTNKGSYDKKTGKWNIGNLSKGKSVTLKIITKATSTGNYTMIASVNSTVNDTNSSNNLDNATVKVIKKENKNPEHNNTKPNKSIVSTSNHLKSTGNPLLMVLLALLFISGNIIRKYKK